MPRRRSAATGSLRALAAVVALLGLLLMHGLSDHGTHHPVAAPASGAGSTPALAADAHAGHAADAAPAAPTPDGSTDRDGSQVAAGLAGLCLAVLATGLLALLVAVAGRPGRGWAVLRAPARGRVVPLLLARLPRPPTPDLHALGVMRC